MTIPIITKTGGPVIILKVDGGMLVVTEASSISASINDIPPQSLDAILASTTAVTVGAEASVLTGSFDVQAYATAEGLGTIPAETGPTQEPIADQGATGDGVADDTTEVVAALAALPSTGGVLDLSQGIFGISGNDDILQIGNKKNITIKGGGWTDGGPQTSGLKVLSSSSTNRFNATIRYTPVLGGNNTDLVVTDLEIDCNNKVLGGITHQFDVGTWINNCYIHDVGDGSANSPLAAIRGINQQDKLRWIGNLIDNTSGAGASAVRGMWTTDLDCTDSRIAHNIVRETGHSGIILHAAVGNPSTIEYNSAIKCARLTGAGMKAEISGNINTSTFNQEAIISTYRRNYVDLARSTDPGVGPFDIQVETFNCDIRENIFTDAVRAIATFDDLRKVTIEDNVLSKMNEYGIYLDANPSGDDKTGVIIRNNSISRDAQSMTHGVFFFPDYSGSIFDFGDNIEIVDNKITDALTADLSVTGDVLAYINYIASGNGSGGVGARTLLLPPPYA